MAPWRPHLAQFIEVKPQVMIEKPTISTPINIELGGLPLSVGLFLGSGLAFLVRTGLPEGWPKTVALVTGAGLAVAGIANLVVPKAAAGPAAGAPAPPPPPPSPPSGSKPAEEKPAGFVPPSASAFQMVVIEMVSPASDQEVDHVGTFLGIGTPKIPVLLRLYNPTAESVSFNLEFEWDEVPTLVGYNRSPNHGAKAFQVTLAPGEERNDPFELPEVTTGLVTSITVGLTLYKKRTPAENRLLVLTRTFSVT